MTEPTIMTAGVVAPTRSTRRVRGRPDDVAAGPAVLSSGTELVRFDAAVAPGRVRAAGDRTVWARAALPGRERTARRRIAAAHLAP